MALTSAASHAERVFPIGGTRRVHKPGARQAIVDAQDFREKAERCRELLRIAVRQEVRDQLRVWVEDFEAEADAIESRAVDVSNRTVAE